MVQGGDLRLSLLLGPLPTGGAQPSPLHHPPAAAEPGYSASSPRWWWSLLLVLLPLPLSVAAASLSVIFFIKYTFNFEIHHTNDMSMIDRFYDVTMNREFMKTTVPRGNKGHFTPLATVNWSTCNLVLCIFLFERPLLYINVELKSNSTATPAWTMLILVMCSCCKAQ